MASFVAFADAIYSVSTDDVATVGCFFEDKAIEPPIDLQLSKSWTQLESVYLTRLKEFSSQYSKTKLKSAVPFR